MRSLFLLKFISVLIFTASVFGQSNNSYSFGVRMGVSDNNYGKNFSHFETDYNLASPNPIYLYKNIFFSFGLNANTGIMESGDKIGFILSAGPQISFNLSNYKTNISLSTMPTYVTREMYKDFSIGGRFHFLSRIGILYRISEEMGIEYSFEHISNGGIVKPNPGVNFHMAGLRFYFTR